MNKYASSVNNDSSSVELERLELVNKTKELSFEHKQILTLIPGMFFELNKKEILFNDASLELPQKSMLKYDIDLSKKELEKTIHKKEVLRKDLAILQNRIRYLENEIRKTKPWWQSFIPFV